VQLTENLLSRNVGKALPNQDKLWIMLARKIQSQPSLGHRDYIHVGLGGQEALQEHQTGGVVLHA
jgi:hypothetical protein